MLISQEAHALKRTMLTRIRTHAGPVRSLSVPHPDRAAFAVYGLVLSEQDCVALITHLEPLESCSLRILPELAESSR
ncbi:MAG: hypothetical protein WCF85_13285 [Rhodospirillaceae bacterium]